jgi:hypothetical protein
MDRIAKKNNLNFLTAYQTARNLYHLDMTEDDFIETAYPVWRSIGNIAKTIRRYSSEIPSDLVLELPPDAEFVKTVTIITGRKPSGMYDSGGYKDRNYPAKQEVSIDPSLGDSVSSAYGIYANYEVGDGYIKFTSNDVAGQQALVIYEAIDKDDIGLPLLNDLEVAAIAAEVTRIDTVRQSFQGVTTKQQMLEYITNEARRLMTAAKMDENMSDDGLNKILDQKVSWDRKVYNRRMNLT